MICIKNMKVLEGINVAWHPNLEKLLMDVYYMVDNIVFTCGYEERETPSVHSVLPLRGLDIRSWIYSQPEKIIDEINKKWQYDYERPEKKVAKLHDSGRGFHIHLQVHDNTKEL